MKVKITTKGVIGHVEVDGALVDDVQSYAIEHRAHEMPRVTLYRRPDATITEMGEALVAQYGGPLEVKYDRARDELVIDGTRYGADLFRALGQRPQFFPIGAVIEIIRREDGLVTLQRRNDVAPSTDIKTKPVDDDAMNITRKMCR